MEQRFPPQSQPPAGPVEIPFPSGNLHCRVSGSGTPILLVHSVNAAASSCEMADLAVALSPHFRVYNLDLPGFGASAKPRRGYHIDTFVEAIAAATNHILSHESATRIDVVALSLSAEFVARCALRREEPYRWLCFISPTGFQRTAYDFVAPEGTTFEKRWLSALLERPFIGRPLYRLLTQPWSIRFFLQRAFGRKDINLRVYDCALATARQPGAEHAPLAFLSGRLFGRDITSVYQRLRHPVFVAHGTRGSFTDFSALAWTKSRSNWRVERFETGALPQAEIPQVFAAALRREIAALDTMTSPREPSLRGSKQAGL